MPRQQRRAAPAPARAPPRPAPAPARPAAPAQNRSASTMAHPPTTSQARPPVAGSAPAQQQSPGLFGQMASTAAGVAVGSSIGHAIGGLFGGGSSSAPAEPAQNNTAAATYSQDNAYSNSGSARACETDAKQFTECMYENQGNLQICGYYLDQLKACQAAASQY